MKGQVVGWADAGVGRVELAGEAERKREGWPMREKGKGRGKGWADGEDGPEGKGFGPNREKRFFDLFKRFLKGFLNIFKS